jgi:hypothetical protein
VNAPQVLNAFIAVTQHESRSTKPISRYRCDWARYMVDQLTNYIKRSEEGTDGIRRAR